MGNVGRKVVVDLGWSICGEISDDHWEKVGPQNICAWTQALTVLERGTKRFENDVFDFYVDWSPVVTAITHSYAETKRLYSTSPPDYQNARFSVDPIHLNIRITPQVNASSLTVELVAEHILIDIFALMNVSNPSALNLHNAKIQTKARDAGEPLRLSCNQFEIALLDSLSGEWPCIEALSVEQCDAWFRAVRPHVTMLPQSRMERVIFAMLHMARGDIDPTRVVWLFYAFEALFDTKIGENFRSLVERIALLLGPTDKQYRYLKRTMRELYDLRSSFVHGGMEVFHPIADSFRDQEVKAVYGRLMTSCDKGFQILLACVQEVIRRKWVEPRFEEVVVGLPV